MSYALPPQVTRAGAPTVNDDSGAGFVIGSQIVNTATTPRTVYICADNSLGAASWIAVPSSDHAALSNLQWANSAHVGLTTAVAAWQANASTPVVVQAASDETMLVRRGGVLQWIPIPVVVAGLIFSGLSGSTPGDLSFGAVTITSGTFA